MRPEKLYLGAKAMPTIPEALLTRKQVAALFQVSTLTVIRLQEAGKLPAVTLGAGSIRYRRADVEAFIAASITPKGQA
jgi:excisionase family DNA binding protein